MSFKPTPKIDPAAAFIEAAEAEKQIVHPWEDLDPKYKDKRIAGVNLRLTETELCKLQYIKTHTNKSIQAFIMDVLLPAITEQIDKIDAAIIEGKKM